MAFTYFIADLHLSQDRPDITRSFLTFLSEQAPQADALYILGDLFEYWLGDDDVTQLSTDVANGLKALSAQTPIFFICGNRDFMLGQRYARACNMVLLPDVLTIDLYGEPYLIMHGDTLCTRDIKYQKFRKKSRSWWWKGIVRALPLWKRRSIAENGRKKSKMQQQQNQSDIMDVTPQEVIDQMQAFQVQRLIHGHTHRPAIHAIDEQGLTGQRIVLGDWYEQSSTLRIDDNGKVELYNQPLG